jgi:hydroxyacylglutathione hydrolase
MPLEIYPITFSMPLGLGGVNCYLLAAPDACLLVDTGLSRQRARLETELQRIGCLPDRLRLILLTHGDFDHTGNAAYLRRQTGAQIAIHPSDAPMLTRGDMFANRGKANPILSKLAALFSGFGRDERVQPDLELEEGFDLSSYGVDAKVLHIPGHSAGSIGLLTADGDLFCGDLLENTKTPALGAIISDSAAAVASFERIKALPLRTIYPGHGKPFSRAELLASEALSRSREGG